MKLQHPANLLVALTLIALLGLASSCSNKANPLLGGGGGTPELDSGNIVIGGSYAHPFAGLGTFNYQCTIHSGMAGQVIVVNGSADSVLVTIGPGNSFNPATVSVKPTGTVRWINSGSTTHTVTSI
jgi:plastocyanin